jgi:hypothetical protein
VTHNTLERVKNIRADQFVKTALIAKTLLFIAQQSLLKTLNLECGDLSPPDASLNDRVQSEPSA